MRRDACAAPCSFSSLLLEIVYEELDKYLLLGSNIMKIGEVSRVSVGVVNQVFKTKAEITGNSERDAWLHDADETFPRGADICVNPVIIPFERNIDPIPEIQRSLELSFPASPIVVISELRSIGSQLRTVSGERYQAELEIEIEV